MALPDEEAVVKTPSLLLALASTVLVVNVVGAVVEVL